VENLQVEILPLTKLFYEVMLGKNSLSLSHALKDFQLFACWLQYNNVAMLKVDQPKEHQVPQKNKAKPQKCHRQ
jgi:hypothetical protein